MKVLYDHQAFTAQYFGGVSKCFCELLLNSPQNLHYKIAIRQSRNQHLLESKLVPEIKMPKIDWLKWHSVYSGSGSSFSYKMLSAIYDTAEGENKRYSIQCLKSGDFDVFHPTFFDPYFVPFLSGKPFVFTVHDMIPEIFNVLQNQIKTKPFLCEKASAIIAVSENTKKDLCEMLNVPESKIYVVYHGGPDVELDKTYRIMAEPYFLYVGARAAAYKNFKQTLADFACFSKKHPEVKLVCTGSEFSKEEIELFRRLDISDRLIHFYADDKQLVNLYSNAVAFLYPSYYEGFGMPILEAYSHGCPVLLNNKSCFPEVAQNAAMYFDSVEGQSNLSLKLEMVYAMNAQERTIAINRGYERLKHFSWIESANQLYKVYESIL